jgi:hypothetical protein
MTRLFSSIVQATLGKNGAGGTDAYYWEWSAKVPVLRAPRDEVWGARTFDLLDPSGNTIFVMGPVSGKKPD